jgi:hypothetical protein|uniref:Uncharacterized protein n=1 Tax=Eutreptiella gymnastica TaxID=73025 RepID=A0A7S4GG02_9EUGL
MVDVFPELVTGKDGNLNSLIHGGDDKKIRQEFALFFYVWRIHPLVSGSNFVHIIGLATSLQRTDHVHCSVLACVRQVWKDAFKRCVDMVFQHFPGGERSVFHVL